MNNSEITKVLLFISSSYPGKMKYPSNDHVADESIEETWLTWLEPYKYETIMMVLRDLLPLSPEWPPTPMQIVNRIKEAAKPPEDRITAEEAWERIIKIVRGPYHYEPDEFFLKDESDLIKRTIHSMGGLNCIRYSEVEDTWPRTKFIDTYNNIDTRIDHEPHTAAQFFNSEGYQAAGGWYEDDRG